MLKPCCFHFVALDVDNKSTLDGQVRAADVVWLYNMLDVSIHPHDGLLLFFAGVVVFEIAMEKGHKKRLHEEERISGLHLNKAIVVHIFRRQPALYLRV